MITFYCGCGFKYEGDDIGYVDATDHTPEPGNCCNCSGRRCMDCVLRYIHDECVDDCPFCCA